MANSISKLAIMLTTDTSGMMKGFAQARAQASQFAAKFNGGGSGGGGMGGMMGMMGRMPPQAAIAIGAIAGLGIAAKKTYDALTPPTQWASGLEQSTASFRVMMGSAVGAKELLEDIRGTSLNFGLDSAAMADQARMMMNCSAASWTATQTLLNGCCLTTFIVAT